MDLTKLLLVAGGGAMGALCRYLVGLAALSKLGEGFPWSTFIVNVVGSFLMGVLVGLGMNSSQRAFLAFGVGFLGSFTTFSAFSVETLKHAEQGQWGVFGANVIANVTICLIAATIGIALARMLRPEVTSD